MRSPWGNLPQTPVRDSHCCCWSPDSGFWHRGERGERCEHNGLVEDCEIAVCQGKTRGQLWAPIAERVGRDSWKEAPAAERRAAKQTPVYPPQLVWPFDPHVAPPPLAISILHTRIKVFIKSCASVCFLPFYFPHTSQRFGCRCPPCHGARAVSSNRGFFL